jgi:nitrogenase subunit NifH
MFSFLREPLLGDVVYGGFATPLNYADYCIIIIDNGFDLTATFFCRRMYRKEKVQVLVNCDSLD